ncbi:hypothetical protein S83_066894 [Arachis hypogaea]
MSCNPILLHLDPETDLRVGSLRANYFNFSLLPPLPSSLWLVASKVNKLLEFVGSIKFSSLTLFCFLLSSPGSLSPTSSCPPYGFSIFLPTCSALSHDYSSFDYPTAVSSKFCWQFLTS